MSIAQRVVRRPTTFFILYVLVVGMALYILPQTPIDLFPDIAPPILLVVTSYSGAGPEEVERSITRPLEGAMTNVSGIQAVNSTSSEGQSSIVLELDWGANLSEATNELRDKLEFVKGFLPEEASTPQIFKFDPSLIPIIQLSLKGNRSPEELFSIAEKQVQPRLEQVNGVAQVSLTGGLQKAVRVEIAQNRLEAYNLTISQVVQALQSQNLQVTSGKVYEGDKKYLVETQGEFQNLEDIRNAMIAYRGSEQNPRQKPHMVQLRDLAEITDSYRDPTTINYLNGVPIVYIDILKQSGTNSVEVANNIMAKIEAIQAILPAGVDIGVIYDTTTIIRRSLQGVASSALMGAILAMAILLFFLRSFRSTLIIGLSIPISLLITVMVMYFSGLTLNIMTLAGLSLGIGMIVDSSIVILENIFRYREKGTKAGPAAYLGTQEMIVAISASILTTVGIFLPLLLFKKELDIVGVLFQDLAITIIVALLASLLIAVSLVPVLSSKYLKLYTRKQRPLKFKPLAALDSWLDRAFKAMDRGYKRFLGLVLDHKGPTLLIIFLILVLSFFTLEPLGGNVGVEFLPTQTQDMVQINIELPNGTRLEVTEKILNQLAAIAKEELKGYQDILVLAGTGGGGFVLEESSHQGMLFITLPPFEERIDSNEVMIQKIRAHDKEFPSVNFDIQSQSFLSNASPIDIILRGEDLEKSARIAYEIKELLDSHVPQVMDTRTSLVEGFPIISLKIDRDKTYALGLNIASVAKEISTAVNGAVAGRYRSDGDEYDILVILQEEDRSTIPDLNRIYFMGPSFNKIPVSSIAHLERSSGPATISREDRNRVIHVTSQKAPGVSLNVAQSIVEDTIRQNIILDEDVILEFSGDYADLIQYIGKFALVMLVALALVYGIMASLFESLLDPFIIFLSIFLIIPGILFLYSIMNPNLLNFNATPTPLSMFSAVGLLMLVGISVNNGIVLVDYSNLLRNRGLKIREATIEAGGNRLRPVLMTSFTTIAGMIPLAFSKGEGAELVRPIGLTIVGGMTMSTLMTLFLVPTLYAMINRKHDSKRKEQKKKTKILQVPGGDS